MTKSDEAACGPPNLCDTVVAGFFNTECSGELVGEAAKAGKDMPCSTTKDNSGCAEGL